MRTRRSIYKHLKELKLALVFLKLIFSTMTPLLLPSMAVPAFSISLLPVSSTKSRTLRSNIPYLGNRWKPDFIFDFYCKLLVEFIINFDSRSSNFWLSNPKLLLFDSHHKLFIFLIFFRVIRNLRWEISIIVIFLWTFLSFGSICWTRFYY